MFTEIALINFNCFTHVSNHFSHIRKHGHINLSKTPPIEYSLQTMSQLIHNILFGSIIKISVISNMSHKLNRLRSIHELS